MIKNLDKVEHLKTTSGLSDTRTWVQGVIFVILLAIPLSGFTEADSATLPLSPNAKNLSTKNLSTQNESPLNKPQPDQSPASKSTMVLIDTTHGTLTVMKDDEAVAYFKHISIGRAGAAALHIEGDDTTPKGTFRVTSEKIQSQYTLFIGLDYPTIEHAELALTQNKIGPEDYQQIIRAHSLGLEPPSTTPLGGAIGIHGIGEGDLSTHHQFNWTRGCIALENEQIRELSRWVEPGVRVNIQ